MRTCPNSYASGCRCRECDIGLAAHVTDPAIRAALLREQARPHRTVTLRVLTMPPDRDPHCDGTMTCACETCYRERTTRPALGAGRAQFKVRAPRAA